MNLNISLLEMLDFCLTQKSRLINLCQC